MSEDTATFFHAGLNVAFACMWAAVAWLAFRLWRRGHQEHLLMTVVAAAQTGLCLVHPVMLFGFGRVNRPLSAATLVLTVLSTGWWWWVNRHTYAILLLRRPPTRKPGMLQVMRGLPGSGKSTHAKAWVDENPDARARVSRDDMRLMLHGGYRNKITEQQVTTACETVAVGLLRAGVDVVADTTCLEPRHLRAWKDVALATRATIKVVDLRGVPLEVCLARNAARANPVPATWVIEQWERHVEPHSGIHH